ncbi:MAG: ABC transporter substrate-binding protein [Pseudomonadota bacterium]|nr:ABC transporter substrate-binding protein [Pseudomonadota bacterium]
MMRITLFAGLVGAAGLAMATTALAQQPSELSVMSFGGAYQAAQRKAFFEPYTAKTGVHFAEQEYGGEIAKIKAMVDTGGGNLDVVDVDGPGAQQGCDEGLYERLDWSKIGNRSDWLPGTATACAVGTIVYGTVLAYDPAKFKEGGPTKLADLFDTKRFPGKRGLWKSPVSNLEFALIADGVSSKDVYKVLATKAGVDRAFKKLDTIKKDVVWWEAGAQAPQLLVSGDVVMTTAWNGRIFNANKEGQHFKIVWDNVLLDSDSWVIPKGAKHPDASYAFIRFTVQPDVLSTMPKYIPYGPVTHAAAAAVPPQYAANLPTSPQNNAETAFATDYSFWGDKGEELRRRFTNWLAQ